MKRLIRFLLSVSVLAIMPALSMASMRACKSPCEYKPAKPFIEDGYVYQDYCFDNPIIGSCEPDPIVAMNNFYECETQYQAGGKRNGVRVEDCLP